MIPSSNAIDSSCFVDSNKDASGEPSLASPQFQQVPSERLTSSVPKVSLEALYRTSIARICRSPVGSFGSKSSGAVHSGTENISPSGATSRTTLHSNVRDESHVVDSTGEEPSGNSIYRTEKTPYLPYGDYVDDVRLSDDTTQIGGPDAPRLTALSVTNIDQEASQDPSALNVKPPVSIEIIDEGDDEEEASAETCSNSNCSPSRKTSPRVVITSTLPNALSRTMDFVRQQNPSGPSNLKANVEREDFGDQFEPRLENVAHLEVPPHQKHGQHRKTSSGFSSLLISAHKRAATDPSSSSGNVSSHKSHWSRLSRLSGRSSRFSTSANRTSLDRDCGPRPAPRKATANRALQRRRIIEELINSESGYLNDLRILTYVYLAILASSQTIDRERLNKVEDNLLSMIALHEEILSEMKSITPISVTLTEGRRPLPKVAKHIRRESFDSLKAVMDGHKGLKGRALEDQAKDHGLTADPKEAADIADLFGKMLGGAANTQLGKFSVYEGYGATYAEMLQACASVSRTIPIWEVVERGVEALVNKVFSHGAVLKEDKKALTFEDLLIKPIQRICRYPLIFAELESYCPAIDDPESHEIVAKVLDRLRETAHEVNNATNDLEAQARLRRSQCLEEMLRFPNAFRPSFSLIRDLGHATLCGVLFVTYQARGGGIKGNFMLCALYNSFLLLASPEPGCKCFTIAAIIGLGNIRLDTASNGQGLQCHETPHTWKVLFEADCELYELLFCGCTELEAERWKSRLQEASDRENQRHNDRDCHLGSSPHFLFLEVEEYANKPKVGGAFGRGRFMRPFAKFTPPAQTVTVVILNTYIPVRGEPTDSQHNAATLAIRSPLQVSTELSQTLVPERVDRIRMEQAMSEIWTRGTLPFPGMTISRSGQLIRASASMMRKMSKTSGTSTPSKRSTSQRSRANTIEVGLDGVMDDPFVERSPINGPDQFVKGSSMHGPVSFESIDIATEMPVFHDSSIAKDPRKVSFTIDLHKPERKNLQDDSSDASTILGKPNDGPKRKKSIHKALSRERIRGWFS